jgi:hypothetical protein
MQPHTSTTNAPLAGLAAIMAFMPFGVSLLTLALGGGCFFIGCCARIGSQMYKKLDSQADVNIKDFYRACAMVLCCLPLSAVASCVVFLAAHVTNIQSDAAFGGLLLVMGVRGPEGFQWLMDNLANMFTKLPTSQKQKDGIGS